MNKDEKLDSTIREYKMSMGGGQFFNTYVKKEVDKNESNIGLGNYLLDMNQMLGLYDNLDGHGRRDLFKKVVEALIELKLSQKIG